MDVNIVCCKWGSKYGPHYVNRLKNMVKANLQVHHNLSFYCYTDDSTGLDADVITVPFPNIPNIHPKYWINSTYRQGLARCWDRAKTFVFNSHNWLNTDGRFVFLDLDVIIQNDIEDLLTFDFDRPTMLRSWWENPANLRSRGFTTTHGTILNGSCQVWSGDQCEVIWKDVLENQEKIWFTFTEGTDNYHYWRWRDLWNTFPSTYAYSYNRGREFPIDAEQGIFRPDCILCVFNVDVMPVERKDRGIIKQDSLVDPNLLDLWK